MPPHRTPVPGPPSDTREHGVGPLDVSDVEQLSELLTWLTDYVSQPHELLGRTGLVCPFVPVSMRSEGMRFVVHSEVTGADQTQLRRVIKEHAARFAAEPVGGSAERRRRSLIIVFPSLGEHLEALDAVHAELKDHIVREGLMFGQFHSRCQDKSVRNPDFRVSLSPVPCVAFRHMAPHDILFLHNSPEWFEEYRKRFGSEFRRGKIKDPLMQELYKKADFDSEESR